jgi:hypothetical protein
MPRLGGGGLGLVMALLLGASCEGPAEPAGESPALSAPATTRAVVSGAPVTTGGSIRPGAGVRVDLAGTTHHVRALERQPDGTYRSICTDSADALRPAAARHPGGPR